MSFERAVDANVNMEIEIQLRYKLIGENIWTSVPLEVSNYFDLGLGEVATLDSAPRFNHASQYISVETKMLSQTELYIGRKDHPKDRLRISEVFWRAGKSNLIEIEDYRKNGSREVIVRAQMSEKPEVVEVIRYASNVDGLKLLFDVFIETLPSGEQVETKVYPAPEVEK